MKKIIPLIFSVLYALNSNAQAVGGWGTCEFADVATMNAFDPSTNAYDCKKVFVQATNNHYYWNGTIWVLVQDTDTDDQTLSLSSNTLSISEGNSVNLSSYLDNTDDQTASEVNITDIGGNFSSTNVEGALTELANANDETIYNTDDALTDDRNVDMAGHSLTFDGTSDVIIQSDGDVGIGVSPTTEFDVDGTGLLRNGATWAGGGNGQLQFGFNSTNTYRHSIKSRHNNGNNNYNGLDFFVWDLGSDALGDLGTRQVMTLSAANSGSVGIGTTVPTAKLDVRDGDVRFADYGDGSYDDASPERLLGVDTDGYVVEVDLAADGLKDNIYNIDDALTENRTVDMAGHSLTFDGTNNVIIQADGDVGIGVSPTTEFDVDGTGLLRNGATWAGGGNGQLQFGFNSTDDYRHSIKSRHNNSNNNYNGLDFFVWDLGSDALGDLGTRQVMTLSAANSGSVGIGTTVPTAKLDVRDGDVRFADYGDGSYDDASPERLLGVDTDGYVVEVDLAADGLKDNIYNIDDALTENRTVDMAGHSLTFDGTNNVIIQADGDVGIGVSPTTEFDVDGTGLLRNGATWAGGGDGQLQFGFNSTDNYRHSIKSRHHSSNGLYNGLDFYVWQYGVDAADELGTLQVMSVSSRNSGSVGIGTTNPNAKFHVFEETGTAASATTGSILLEHNNSGGSSSIVFKSRANANSDFGYINYSDDGSGNGGNAENSLLTIGVQNDGVNLNQDDIAIMPTGNVGIGTIAPAARLDVDGGTVKFSDYGTGSNTGVQTYLLAVDADGDVIETPLITNTDDQTATEVSIVDAGGNFTSTNVEGALTELANATDDNIYNTDGTLGENREVTLDGNSLTFKGSSDVIIQADGDVGIGTVSPSGRLHATNITDRNGFIFESANGLTGEKDVFTIQDNDTGGGGQDHSSVLKVHKNANINNSDEGFSLIELANTGTNPNGNEYWISGRKSDEGAPEWGVQINDNQIWSSGGILLNATGAANGTYSGGDFIVESGGDVGIGTNSPAARLDVDGGTVKFSDYGTGTNTGTQTFLLAVDADGDVIETPLVTNTDAQNLGLSGTTLSITGGNNVNLSGLADNLGNHTATTDLNMSTHDIDFTTGNANFGSSTRQMVNLWSTAYGIGVQSNTQYYRTGNHFAWYRGGSHNGSALNNGGGSTMMILNSSGDLGLGGINPSYKLQVSEGTNTSASITTTSESGDATLFLGTPFSGSTGAQKTAIIAEGQTSWSRAKLHFALEGSSGDNSVAANADISDSKMTIQYDGNVGIGTTTPDAKLDVEGGSVRFTDYGSGTYDNTSTASHILGVQANGDVVEMNTATNSRIFYPPAIAIIADAIVVDETLDLHQTYVDLFAGGGSTFISSTSAPGAIPTYDQDELYYYILDYDTAVFANVTIDANGLMEYDVIAPASGDCSFINIVFVVK